MTRAAADSAPRGRPFRPLRGRSAFSRIYQEGVRRSRGGITVFAAPGEPGCPQVGVVAGKRVGNAVRRNRAKRRLRAALCEVLLREGTAYVVIAGPGVLDVEFGRIGTWLRAAIDGRSVDETKENE